MSNYSITSLYPFRRVKVEDFYERKNTKLGSVQRVVLTPDERYTPLCHERGKKVETVHSNETRRLRDNKIAGKNSEVIYHYRKIKCPECEAIKVEKSDVTNPGGVEITNRFARHRIHTSILEGINNKIKGIKKSAFGFHDFNYFKLKIKFAFQGDKS